MKNKEQYPSRETILLRVIRYEFLDSLKDALLPTDLKYLSDPAFMMRAIHADSKAIKYASRKIRFNRKFRALAKLEKERQDIEDKLSNDPDNSKLKAGLREIYLDIHKLREEIRNENGYEAQ